MQADDVRRNDNVRWDPCGERFDIMASEVDDASLPVGINVELCCIFWGKDRESGNSVMAESQRRTEDRAPGARIEGESPRGSVRMRPCSSTNSSA